MVCAPVQKACSDRRGAQTMLYHNCTMTSYVDLARYRVFRGKNLGMCGLWYNDNSNISNCFIYTCMLFYISIYVVLYLL